ncbi:MAG: hypothetical protein ACYC0V_01580 [Armatimonadota bacterium]
MILTTVCSLAAGMYCIKTARELGLGGICKVAKATIIDAGDNVRAQLKDDKARKTECSSDAIVKQLLEKATPEEKAVIHDILNREEDPEP